MPTSISEILKHDFENMEEFCKTCIKNKHIRIVKLKKMIPTTKKLQEIYANLLGSYKLISILGKNYVYLIFNKFTCKL